MHCLCESVRESMKSNHNTPNETENKKYLNITPKEFLGTVNQSQYFNSLVLRLEDTFGDKAFMTKFAAAWISVDPTTGSIYITLEKIRNKKNPPKLGKPEVLRNIRVVGQTNVTKTYIRTPDRLRSFLPQNGEPMYFKKIRTKDPIARTYVAKKTW